ncbi:hypothetical protein NX059_008619 [Plenodomus lindquistii]|nr:hypothetical protein NX059_008619 [Plenodomus lindquistii]
MPTAPSISDQTTSAKVIIIKPSNTVWAFTKCVLLMSDVQILTGLSILISGYAQLHCGLSVYHWQILVYLTWFCSLTHLSCLTFLRNYLHHHPGERWWRLIGMGLLVVMLIVALLPTGNYSSHNDPANYAICSFHELAPTRKERGSFGINDEATLNYVAMIISVLLMGLGYISRVVRLHPSMCTLIIGNARKGLSSHARRFLRIKHESYRGAPDPSRQQTATLKMLLFYRPFLAVFLVWRIVLDLWSSLALEVWWLVASYTWGIYNLRMSLKTHSKSPPNNNVWTFGQIAPIILLLAPILSMVESHFESSSIDAGPLETTPDVNEISSSQVPSRTETMQIATNTLPIAPDGVQDHSDHDFYQEQWYKSLAIFAMVAVICVTIIGLYLSPYISTERSLFTKGAQVAYLIPSVEFWIWPPVSLTMSFMNIILFCLLFENLQWHSKFLHMQIWTLSLLVYIFLPTFSSLSVSIVMIVLAGTYICLSVFYIRRAKRTP